MVRLYILLEICLTLLATLQLFLFVKVCLFLVTYHYIMIIATWYSIYSAWFLDVRISIIIDSISSVPVRRIYYL